MKKSWFFQKWYSESSENCNWFHSQYHFLKPHWHRFRLKKLFWHPMASVLLSKLLYRVIALQQSNSECLKWHQSHYRSIWKQKLDFKPPRKLLGLRSSWSLQKKLFLKCQQATSNPNLEWSKLPMTKLCICF